MSLTFRKAVPADVPLIATLAEKIWKAHYISIISMEQIGYMLSMMYSESSLLQQMEQGHVFTLVYSGSKPMGYLSLSTKDQRNYFLHKFYIDTDEQRKGLGSALFSEVLKDLDHADTIELTVNRSNYKAINFYFRQGFVIKEVADFDIGNGYFMNDFVMIRRSGKAST